VAIIFGVLLLFKPLALLAQESKGGGGEIKVSEESLNLMPCLYLKKKIVTEGVFLDASPAILDDRYHDKNTKFSSKAYLNFRTNYIFQYFMDEEKAEIIPTLKAGNRIIISGHVTSCEDKRPWVEVDSVVKAPSK
jgi:CRISPR/Cas system-associated protein Csx1